MTRNPTLTPRDVTELLDVVEDTTAADPPTPAEPTDPSALTLASVRFRRPLPLPLPPTPPVHADHDLASALARVTRERDALARQIRHHTGCSEEELDAFLGRTRSSGLSARYLRGHILAVEMKKRFAVETAYRQLEDAYRQLEDAYNALVETKDKPEKT